MKCLIRASFSVSVVFSAALLVLSGSATRAFAKPLTLEDIKSAKRIGIMPGSFDPITLGHLAAATAAVEKGGVDIVILTPMENPHKQPIARTERLKMIDLGAFDQEKIVYAKEGGDLYQLFSEEKIWTVVSKLREINPNVAIDIVAGSDFDSNADTTFIFSKTVKPDRWVVINRPGEPADLSKTVLNAPHILVDAAPTAGNISSSAAKKYLEEHLELYSQAPSEILVPTVPGVELEVERFIIANGLYKVATQPSLFQRVLQNFWKP